MNVNLLFYTCVSDWTLCLGQLRYHVFSTDPLFVRYVFWFCDNPLASLHYCYSSLKGCVVCCPSENRLQSLHSVTGFTACLCCLRCCLSQWPDFAFVNYHQHSYKTCISKGNIFTHLIFWPCAPFDPSFVHPAYPLWKQPAEPAPFWPASAAARWRPLQVWNQPKASDRSQQSKSLKKRDVSWCVLNVMIGSKVGKKRYFCCFQ